MGIDDELYEKLKNLDTNTVPVQDQVSAFYHGLKGTYEFASKKMVPLLEKVTCSNRKHVCIRHIYFCMYCWLGSLTQLNKRSNHGAIASCLRTMFEHYLDIKLLARGTIQKGPDKYESFPRIQRFTTAVRSVNLANRHSIPLNTIAARLAMSVNAEEKDHVTKLVTNLWGKTRKGKANWPKHWSGMNLSERAAAVDKACVRMYLDIVYPCNLYVHSDPTGYAGKDADFFRERLEAWQPRHPALGCQSRF